MTRTILLTGTSSGLGEASARAFLAQGWNVVATARKADAVLPGVEEARLLRARLDTTDTASIAAAFNAAEARFGAIDVVVNNAGIGLGGPLEEIDLDRLRNLFEVNTFGAVAVSQEAIRRMRPRRKGLIVNVTSMAGQVGLPFLSPYSASKFALEGLTEALYYELKPFGIGVKLVEPGGIRTAFANPWGPAGGAYEPASGEVRRSMEAGSARAALPEDVAGVLLAAVNDPSPRLRYRTRDVAAALRLRRVFPEAAWRRLIARSFGLATR